MPDRVALERSHDVTAVVLGGGRGTRLYPLTRYRSKPAVPLAGKYRLIDVPISNCINSGIRKIFVLTQFLSASLNHHIAQTYHFDQFSRGFVEILAAEQTLETEMWYQGTADAVRKGMRHILQPGSPHILILSGDALWRQDFRQMVEEHEAANADITIGCKLVNANDASGFGIVGIDETRRITSFHEKPSADALGPLKVDPEVLRRAGLNDVSKPYLASMGVYLFRRSVLEELLNEMPSEDFGKQMIPSAIPTRRIFAHLFDGYWEDIGTIKSFFWANINLLNDSPGFDFYDAKRPIYTHSRILPSSEVADSHLERVWLAEGCQVKRASIRQSIIGIRSIIGEGAEIENSVIMGADYYEQETPGSLRPSIPLGIGKDAVIRNAIIDKNARIGDGVKIVNHQGVEKDDGAGYSIRDGIVIVPKNAMLAPGTLI